MSVDKFLNSQQNSVRSRVPGFALCGMKSLMPMLLAGAALAVFSTPAAADSRDDRIKALENQLNAVLSEIKELKQEQAADKATLSAQVLDLKRGSSSQNADIQNQRASDVKTTFSNGRPTIASADGKSTLSLRSLVQYDSAYYAQPNRSSLAPDLSSGSNFRRARFGFDGKAFDDWSFSFLYDLGGTGVEGAKLSDAYVQYDGWAPFHFRTGSFSTPGGLDDQTSAGDLIFLERAGPTDLARSVAGSDGRKNLLSISAYGDDYYAAATWSVSRAADPAVFDQQNAAVGRLAYRLYKDADTNIQLSGTGSYVFKVAAAAASTAGASTITFQEGPESTVDATRLISSGAINADSALVWGIEAGANWKNFYAQGGYFGYSIARRASTLPDPEFDGWYLQGTWVLTGESRRYNATTASWGSPRPSQNFDLKSGALGAWELALRYSQVDLNYNAGTAGSNPAAALGSIRGGVQDGFTAGLNWYPNSVIRFLLDYQRVNVDRLATTAPFQRIGQDFNIFSVRSQLAF